MSRIDDFVNRQKTGATFVITAPMLSLTLDEFDTVARV